MKLVYSRRALTNLDRIATYYATHASATVTASIGRRTESVLDRIARSPESAPRVSQRSQVRVANVIRYPFQIFYRRRGETIDILSVRHTSRQPVRT